MITASWTPTAISPSATLPSQMSSSCLDISPQQPSPLIGTSSSTTLAMPSPLILTLRRAIRSGAYIARSIGDILTCRVWSTATRRLLCRIVFQVRLGALSPPDAGYVVVNCFFFRCLGVPLRACFHMGGFLGGWHHHPVRRKEGEG